MGPVLGLHARTNRTRDTRVAEPWLPAPEDRRPGEGQRLTPDAPHNGGRHPPRGPPFRHPHSEQRRPARPHAVGLVLGPHARTDRTRDTRVAEPWLPAPEDGRPGEGQRLTPDAPHNDGRHAAPPGTAPYHPRGTQPPQGMQARGTVLGPHTHTPAPTARGWRTPTAPPVGGQLMEGQRLTSDAPHTMVEGTPHGDALPPPPQRATPARKGTRCGASAGSSRPHRPHPGHMGRGTLATRSRGRAAGGGTAPDTRRPSQWWKAPPPGDALPPPPQRATPARRGARCGAGAGSPRPHRPHPGHTGHGTPAARSRGRAAGEGSAPDTRRHSQRWQATPPGDGPPPPPRHAAPTGHTGAGDSVGPPHRHTRAHSTWVADPNSAPSGWAVGGGGAPDVRRPSQRWKAHPPRMPFRHFHSEQRRPARAHAVGPVLGPHARTDRTRDTRVAEPRLPAPEDGRPGEGQRLTPDAPHNGGRPASPGRAPHHPRGTQPPQGMKAKGTVLGPHTDTPAPRACGWRTPTARPVGEQLGEGERLTTDAPQNSGKRPPRNALPPPPQRATPARKGARCGAGAGSPRPQQLPPGSTGRGTPAARPIGRAAGGGTAPDTRRPSQRWQATPPGDGPPPPPAARTPRRACRPRGQCWAPTPTHPRPQDVGGGPQQPAQWAGSRGRDSA